MEILVLLGVFLLVAIVSIAGWTPDTRTGRDWQPRDGWKPFLDLRRRPGMKSGWPHSFATRG
jgi:hypothetical protein